eukprot:GHVS01108304.1.p1 GENE.GHVS01108304.1~~GHVS01108304.1.p1  ORF type:complete len:109 (-),score=6.36 GHVS01108304.1:1164-1457(-)
MHVTAFDTIIRHHPLQPQHPLHPLQPPLYPHPIGSFHPLCPCVKTTDTKRNIGRIHKWRQAADSDNAGEQIRKSFGLLCNWKGRRQPHKQLVVAGRS